MNKVIFDNKCPFCSSINNRLERLDLLNLFLWVPSDKYMQSDNIHPSINKQIINKSIIVLNNRNNIMLEFFACRYIVSRIPFFYPILIFLYIPFLSSYLGNIIYRNIAIRKNCYLK